MSSLIWVTSRLCLSMFCNLRFGEVVLLPPEVGCHLVLDRRYGTAISTELGDYSVGSESPNCVSRVYECLNAASISL